MPTTVRLEMTGANAIIARKGLDAAGEAQEYLTTECAKRMEGYMPKVTGSLIAEMQIGIDAKAGKITVNAPQARYLYYGKVMVGRPPKVPTDKDLKYTTGGNAKAGPLWDKRMWEDHGSTILDGLAERIGGRKG